MPSTRGLTAVLGVAAWATLAMAPPALSQTAPGSGLSVSGGPATELAIDRSGQAATTYTLHNPSAHGQHVDVLVTGLRVAEGQYFFDGRPSAGLTVTATPMAVDLPAGGGAVVQVAVSAGPAIAPGGAYAGIVFRAPPPPAPAGASTVAGEIARPLLVAVRGSFDDGGTLIGFKARPSGSCTAWEVAFLDTGNVHYPVGGTVDLFDGARRTGTLDLQSKQALPGAPLAVRTPCAAPRGKPTRAQAHVRWGRTGEHDATIAAAAPAQPATAKAFGWPFWISLLLLLLVLLLLLALLQRRRDRPAPEGDEARA